MTDSAAEATLREVTLKNHTTYWKVLDQGRPLHLETRAWRLLAGTTVSVGPARAMYIVGEKSVQAAPFIRNGEDCYLLLQDLGMLESPAAET